ncbi:YtxH domain-containing protein [Dehalogenimonas sp. 4OHTPN]|uniref:YtxH domain-containing protein n=1 Tax=Dehalogenimonas sp. 4OHTPN TaxID=3166643 RepID=A0AAU8GAZ0_9CHLR
MSNQGNFIGGFALGLLTGAAVGAVVSLLYAPYPGKKTRRLIQNKIDDMWDTGLDCLEDVKDEVEEMADKTQEFVKEAIDSAAAKKYSENNLGG